MKDNVISPYELLKPEKRGYYRINSEYYLTKHVIPVLNRGVDGGDGHVDDTTLSDRHTPVVSTDAEHSRGTVVSGAS